MDIDLDIVTRDLNRSVFFSVHLSMDVTDMIAVRADLSLCRHSCSSLAKSWHVTDDKHNPNMNHIHLKHYSVRLSCYYIHPHITNVLLFFYKKSTNFEFSPSPLLINLDVEIDTSFFFFSSSSEPPAIGSFFLFFT